MKFRIYRISPIEVIMFRMPGSTCGFHQPCQVKDGTSALVSPPAGNPTIPALPKTRVSAFVGGTPLNEAKSLLRPCLPRGVYGRPLSALPGLLEEIVGRGVKISNEQLAKYLRNAKILEADLGGPLRTTLPRARYLVIHDTSSGLARTFQAFPDKVNESSWDRNQLSNVRQRTNAHVFITRVGTSYTAHDFSVPYSATKYTNHQTAALKIKFCHVELIQPRLIDSHGSDWKAPNPGFPGTQLERLALVYIAASIRHGGWLIPAYHHNIDMGLPAHDDPQNFDLAEWAAQLEALQKKIFGIPQGGSFPVTTDIEHRA
jgi:hypothetical protein